MSPYSEIYSGYTITLVGTRYHIAGKPYVDFGCIDAARRFIDKLTYTWS